MKKYSAILLSTLMMGGAMAQASINFDMRADYMGSTFDKTSPNADNAQFRLKMARIDAKGKLNDVVDYRARFRLSLRRDASFTSKENLGTDTDFFFVTNKISDNLSLQIGKLYTDVGGWENAYSSADLYMESMMYTEADPAYSHNGIADSRYAVGAKLAYLIDASEIDLVATNLAPNSTGPGNDGSAGKFDQNKLLTGVVFKGSFMDKKLLPIVSYHMASGNAAGAGQNDDKSKNTYMAVALKYNMDPVVLELNYLSNVLGSLTTVDQNDKLDTMLLDVSYTMNQWTGRAKVESSIAKKETSATAETKTTYTGYQLAVEYKPVKEDNFRYHLAYWSRDSKAETATTSTTTTDKFVLVGVKLLADILK